MPIFFVFFSKLIRFLCEKAQIRIQIVAWIRIQIGESFGIWIQIECTVLGSTSMVSASYTLHFYERQGYFLNSKDERRWSLLRFIFPKQ